jgi:hypothetical protein
MSTDYVAFNRDGFAYALCSADQPRRYINEFFRECAGSEIRIMPVGEAVTAHLAWITELDRRQARNRENPSGVGCTAPQRIPNVGKDIASDG